jgi:aryl-alcohol dehydrogenase-like predicted oxidoreductase
MTAHSDFIATVRPCFESFVAEGLIGAWGLTGIGHPDAIIKLLADSPAPAVVQCIANAMDSPGALKFYDEPARPRDIIAAAQANGVGVMGIRAVQAGALTDAIDRDLPNDHPEVRDYNAAAAYRALAAELGLSAAALGHRYALSMPGVDTVVLGVKNRKELAECVAAAEAGPLSAEIMERVDNCFPGR